MSAAPDEAFPRGGSSSKARHHKRPAPERDALFGQSTTSSTSGSKSNKRPKTVSSRATTSTSLLPLGGGGVVPAQGKKEAYIEALSFSKLGKGTKLMGIVRDVQEEYAVVALPNLLTGYILKRENDPIPCTHALSVHQVLCVVIVKTAVETVGAGVTRRRIQVSALPSAMQQHPSSSKVSTAVLQRGRIASVEDHGCLVDLGHGRRGFLKFEHVQGEYTVEENYNDEEEEEDVTTTMMNDTTAAAVHRLNVGRILDFLVAETYTASSVVVPLTLPSRRDMARHTVPSTHHPTLQALHPGNLVQARVEVAARNGLCVTFLGGVFRGAIEEAHLGGYWIPTSRAESNEWKDVFLGKTLQARILAVDAATKVVRLTLQPHLLQLQSPHLETRLPPVGTVVENATVVRLDPGVGALLALPGDDNDDEPDLWPPLSKDESYVEAAKVRAAYVHISKSMDGRVPENVFAKEFAPSTKHTLRIMGTTHWVEGVASCATADSVVNAHVLTHSDLVPGKVYRGVPVCGQLEGGSIMIDFGMGVRGLIPQQHLFDQISTSDYRARLRKEKFAVGAKVDVRCLSVDIRVKKCLVTAKKSLLKSKDAITNYEGLTNGTIATGFISRIDYRGLYVTFYNKVYGRVTARSLAAELGIEDHRANYQVGDVVTCRVISCRKRVGKNVTQYQGEDDDDDVPEEGADSRKGGYWELNLSLDLHSSTNTERTGTDAPSGESSRVNLHSGAVLPAKCMKVIEFVPSKEKKTGGFIPGHAIVSIKSKHIIKDESDNRLSYVECKLPFDQLMDSYSSEDIETGETLDNLAKTKLTVGKKINHRGIVLSDPKKTSDEYSSGVGRLPIVSLREQLIAAVEEPQRENSDRVLLPGKDTHLFTGAYVCGFVAQVDPRFGSFVRFLDKVTGLVPKLKSGLNLPRYGTVTCQIVALDVSSTPTKILLKPAKGTEQEKTTQAANEILNLKPGDAVGDVKVLARDTSSVRVNLLDKKFRDAANIRAQVHVTMVDTPLWSVPSRNQKPRGKKLDKTEGIPKHHPFYKWPTGTTISGLKCAAIDSRKGMTYVELTTGNVESSAFRINDKSQLPPGTKVPAVVTGISESKGGLWVQVSPYIKGFIPGLELCRDAHIPNSMKEFVPLGVRIDCRVMQSDALTKKKQQSRKESEGPIRAEKKENAMLYLSPLLADSGQPEDDNSSEIKKPVRGDLMIGRINHRTRQLRGPALMLDLRGGYHGRCCITELEEMDEWTNMPFRGLRRHEVSSTDEKIVTNVVTDEEMEGTHERKGDEVDRIDVEMDRSGDESESGTELQSDIEDRFVHGNYVQCRVLAGIPSQPVVEVSLRSSRLEGDLEEDEVPQAGDVVQGYVISTNRKGCFIRLSRRVEGRATLKELCDGFLTDPASSFPPGRLVVGKIKEVHEHKPASKKKKTSKEQIKATVDLDMRESTLLESEDNLAFDDIEIGSKHKGVVTRLESYGVFVRLENSDVSGLVHKSECSDSYIKNLSDLYDPGDFVKVLVLKKDTEQKKIGFSMKASHFQDSDDSSVEVDETENDQESIIENERADSDDDNFASKLASQMVASDESVGSESKEDLDNDEGDKEISSDDESEQSGAVSERTAQNTSMMDTDVGFQWATGEDGIDRLDDEQSATSASEDGSFDGDDDEVEDDVIVGKDLTSSRKKKSARRREEQEITRRETALAEGTADDNPETVADFERLLASEPNRSEHWIRYMAYHLSLADVHSARTVASRAFNRIEFRHEGEKLNVWTALMTLELKYGSPNTFQEAVDSACQQNNPKQVYLRACELLEKEMKSSSSSSDLVSRADEMFRKMCRKLKNKKSVWIAFCSYLLRSGRHQEAHEMLKRGLKSLPEYKHIETMSRFAQLEMEHGSLERGRTLMDGLLSKYPKRIDLLFVYVDKEVKVGELAAARTLLQSASQNTTMSDKQMKSLFKKWYRLEQEHGNAESCELVKNSARAYVEQTNN